MGYPIRLKLVAIGALGAFMLMPNLSSREAPVRTEDFLERFTFDHSEDSAPSKKVFVFDFHGTIADTDVPKAVATGIAYLPASMCYLLYQLLWKRSLIRHIWDHGLTKKYPFMVLLKDACGHAAACQTLRPKVVDAIEQLHRQGHRLYIFSGITPRPHAILKAKYPYFFNFFDKIICVGLDGWPSKHDQAFYELADKLISQDAGSKPHVVFFDNERENCARGDVQRWQTVHVTSAEQCADKIKELAKR